MLSQWRGYGEAGGYSIAFRPGSLVETGINTGPSGKGDPFDDIYPNAALGKVLYGADNPKSIASELLDIVKSNSILADSSIRAPWNALFALALVKHEAFTEESEQRVVYIFDDEIDNNPRLLFRTHPILGIAPYVEIPFIRERAIRGIVVGPGPDRPARINAARRLLHSYGLHVPVWESSAPYRG